MTLYKFHNNSALSLGTIFRNIFWENNRTINIVDIFFIFPIKVVSKFSYYSLLTIVLRAFVNMTLSKIISLVKHKNQTYIFKSKLLKISTI